MLRYFENFFAGIGYYVGSFVLLALRLYFGYSFVIAGWGKVTNIAEFATTLEGFSMAYPLYCAYAVAFFETVGGVALIVGYLARLFSLPLIVIMCVAYATAHYDALIGVLGDPKNFMDQAPFMHLLTAALVFSFGPGAFSLSNFIEYRREKEEI